MYIKRLETWSDEDWEFCLKDIHPDKRKKVRQILTLPSKEAIEWEFSFLRRIGIINGIGANWMGKLCISIITFLCPSVRYDWHDIQYMLGGTKEDKEKADFGLLKYSILSIVGNFWITHTYKIFPIVKELIIILILLISFIQMTVIVLFWRILIYFGGKAFKFTNK